MKGKGKAGEERKKRLPEHDHSSVNFYWDPTLKMTIRTDKHTQHTFEMSHHVIPTCVASGSTLNKFYLQKKSLFLINPIWEMNKSPKSHNLSLVKNLQNSKISEILKL